MPVFTYWDDETGPRNGIETVWGAIDPAFRVFRWPDVRAILQRTRPHAVDLVSAIRIPACRSDVARLVILEELGGLYLDAHCGTRNVVAAEYFLDDVGNWDLVIAERPLDRAGDGHRQLGTSVLGGRPHSSIVTAVLDGVLAKLAAHRELERATDDHVPYNIAGLTGAWNFHAELFDVSVPGESTLRPEFIGRVLIWSVPELPRDGPISLYEFYSYRQQGQHWSQRQEVERLFA